MSQTLGSFPHADRGSSVPGQAVTQAAAEGEASAFVLELPPALVEAVARRAAQLNAEQDAGYLDVAGAARFLGGCSRKRIYNLVERGVIPHHKPHGRLLFDPRELREWVEGSR
jgi:excisionase family DNA binding protein